MSSKDETIKQHVFVMDWIREVAGNNKIEGRITVDEDQLKSIMNDFVQVVVRDRKKHFAQKAEELLLGGDYEEEEFQDAMHMYERYIDVEHDIREYLNKQENDESRNKND